MTTDAIRVILTNSDRFGPDGPTAGTEGTVIESHYDPDGELWFKVIFKGFSPGYHVVSENVVRILQ